MKHKYFSDINWESIGTHKEWEKKVEIWEAYMIAVKNRYNKAYFKDKSEVKKKILEEIEKVK